jgi:hypothetical protein
MIEAALRESGGRVSGRSGAGRQTWNARIDAGVKDQVAKDHKNLFKTVDASLSIIPQRTPRKHSANFRKFAKPRNQASYYSICFQGLRLAL